MQFRGDIEGLRGVAVGLVVLAHAGVPGFAGGFIGVDVFFVISGFLITGLLWNEKRESGRIDLWHFYARRARRLAPAVLTVLVLVSLVAYWLLPISALGVQAESAAWAALWSSNMYFAITGFDYFGSGVEGSLWLHTWSLGVEEQFYLVWPGLLLLAGGRRHPIAWFGGIALASFLVCQWAMQVDGQFAYYSMPTRLWQLAAGGALSVALESLRLSPRAATAAGVTGIVLLAASVVLAADVAWPGPWSILPVVATVALIASGAGADNAVTRVLASPALRLPGRISYSWYLWHWPVLMFWPLLGIAMTSSLRAGAVLLSFLLAWASWAWVEAPFRRRKGQPTVAVGIAVLGSLVLAAILLPIARMPLPPAAIEAQIAAMMRMPALYDDPRCDTWYESAEVVPCVRVESPGGSTIVLIGDSIGAQWAPAVEALARARAERLVVLTKSSCPIADVPFFYERIRRRFVECEQWREGVLDWVETARPSLVVIGSSGYPFSPAEWRAGIDAVLARIPSATQVVLLAPTPVLTRHGAVCAARNARSDGRRIVVEGCDDPLADVEASAIISALRDAAAGHPNARVLSMNDAVCAEGICRAFADGRLVFRDTQHLNAGFVESIAEEFVERVETGRIAAEP